MPTFEIPDGPTSVELKRSGNAQNPGPATGSVAFSVTNKSGDGCDGRLSVVPSGGSKLEWFTIDGDRERTFGAGETQTATIKVSAPAATAAGDYPFRLRAVVVNDPDNDHAEGPVATAKVPPPQLVNGGFHIPWWVWLIVGLVVLLLISLVLWFTFGNSGSKTAAVEQRSAAHMGALETGFDRSGSDFGMVKLPNADECAKLCQAYEPCRAVTYISPSGICMIKNAIPNQTPNAQVISAIKIPAK
jgi:hypothetical protein